MKLESSVSKYQQPYSGYWLGEIQEPQPPTCLRGGGLMTVSHLSAYRYMLFMLTVILARQIF
jgi:hypothetical protein